MVFIFSDVEIFLKTSDINKSVDKVKYSATMEKEWA